jgi:hypothetical protein
VRSAHLPAVSNGVRRIAYEQSLRALDLQSGALSDLRSRAGTLLAAASVVAAFLGAPALQHDSASLGVAVAFVALIGVLVLTLLILRNWTFTFRLAAATILEDLEAGKYVDEDDAVSRLARFMEENHDVNETRLRLLGRTFEGACVLLIIETLALMTAV